MKLSAVLLAGGESRRMGQDKATLLVGGKPLWQRQLELLRSVSPSEILISARKDPVWRPADCRFVPDALPYRGPLSGITASLGESRQEYSLVLAVDMPWMNAGFLIRLGQEITVGRGVVSFLKGHAEPLCAIYPSGAIDILRAALAGNDFSMQRVVSDLIDAGRLHAIKVENEDAMLFGNLNEPADLPEVRPLA